MDIGYQKTCAGVIGGDSVPTFYAGYIKMLLEMGFSHEQIIEMAELSLNNPQPQNLNVLGFFISLVVGVFLGVIIRRG